MELDQEAQYKKADKDHLDLYNKTVGMKLTWVGIRDILHKNGVHNKVTNVTIRGNRLIF